VEVWRDGELAGGLYGVALGRVFFGESMFSFVSDASKVALVHLCQTLAARGFILIDCQMNSDHLARLGAVRIPRGTFSALLDVLCADTGRPGPWHRAPGSPTHEPRR
jgi:leucyl/phenylalanyl-tRNA--protein transferase